MPNLLKYRDEYSKKSGHAPDNVPSRTEGEGEGEQIQSQKEKVPVASTASAAPAILGKLLGTLPLNDGTDWEVYSTFADELQPLYPAVDVRQELRAMKGWLIGNPDNRKTKKGIKRFITTWLGKEQNKARPNGGTNGTFKSKTDSSLEAGFGLLEAIANRRTPDDSVHSEAGKIIEGRLPGLCERP
jgi:hypothetical protein